MIFHSYVSLPKGRSSKKFTTHPNMITNAVIFDIPPQKKKKSYSNPKSRLVKSTPHPIPIPIPTPVLCTTWAAWSAAARPGNPPTSCPAPAAPPRCGARHRRHPGRQPAWRPPRNGHWSNKNRDVRGYNLLVLSREWMGLGVAGMIIDSYCGSFPRSLLSTSKIMWETQSQTYHLRMI